MITVHTPLLAKAGATAEQCSRFIVSRPHGGYTDLDVRIIVAAYFSVAATVGLDPLLLIAQMVHETGNLTSAWSQRPHRNPAGIGVTGEPGKGVSFPTWVADAVPAHVGRLLAYALRNEQCSAAQRALITKALNYRLLPVRYRGTAPTLNGLTGTWAKDPDYTTKLVRMANAIQAVAR